MKILIVENDPHTSDFVVGGLVQEGHDVERCASGPGGLDLAVSRLYDALVVDRTMADLDALSFIREYRSSGRDAPVLLLTSLSGAEERVEALQAGADDYLSKPFAFSELVARLNALERHAPRRTEEEVLEVAGVELQLVSRRVSRDGVAIDLRPREFQLLEYFMRNRRRILTHAMLLQRVWDIHFDPKSSIVETHVRGLRTKIDKPFDHELIRTIPGTGYCFDPVR